MGIWGKNRKEDIGVQNVTVVLDVTDERIAKLNALAAEEKQTLEETYRRIGKKYVETHEDYDPKVFEALLEDVRRAESEIDWLNGYIDDLKGILRCPQCGHTLSSDSKYCNYCGTKLNIVEYVPCPTCGAPIDPQKDNCIFCGGALQGKTIPENGGLNDTILVDEPQARVCKKCGYVLKENEFFCIQCGTKYE